MPALPLLTRGFSSPSSGSSGYRGSGTSSSSGLSPGVVVTITSSTAESGGSGDLGVAVYTVIGFFAVVAFCIAAFAICRCTRPCRMARRRQRPAKEKTPARQATDNFRAERDYLRRQERERQAIEAALIIQMSFPEQEMTRYNTGHRSVRPTEISTVGLSAGVRLSRPEPALHRTRSTNASDPDSRPATPLPKYERYDPLRKREETAELHPVERSPSYTERDSPSSMVEREGR